MIFIHPILYWTAALLSTSALPHPDETADHVVFEQNDKLLGRVGTGPAEVLCDSGHYEKADGPQGPSYVVLRYDERRSWLTILECDPKGNLKRVRTVLDERLNEATAIVDASFLPDGRLFAVLHASPSVDVAVALNTRTRDSLILRGYGFTWDVAGKHIANLLDAPRIDAGEPPTSVWLDGKKVADPGENWKSLAWNANGTELHIQFEGKPDLIVPVSGDSMPTPAHGRQATVDAGR